MNLIIKKLTGAERFSILFSKKRRGSLFVFLCGLLGILIFTADQLLKASIERQPDDSFPRDVPGLGSAARYEKCQNPGFILGALKEAPELVRTLPALIAAALFGRLTMLLSLPGRAAEKLGLTMIVSGAASNVYDRFSRGYVVDYVSIKKGALGRLVLNLGDLAIFFGAAVHLLGRLLHFSAKK